jgi:hypothetical protein
MSPPLSATGETGNRRNPVSDPDIGEVFRAGLGRNRGGRPRKDGPASLPRLRRCDPLPQTDRDRFDWRVGELVIGQPRPKQVVAERLCRGGPDVPKDVLQHGGSGNAA